MQLSFSSADRTKPRYQADCSIGEFDVSLSSDLRQVHDDFVALYPQRRAANTDPSSRIIRIGVHRAGRTVLGRSLYRVTADGHEIGAQYPCNHVFPFVEWGINLRIMATRSEFVQLHAASMVHQGNGFIFAGDSGCGKSTLAATLVAHGWQYLCDEFALVEQESLTLRPFPKALCIKAGSYELIRKLGLPFARRCDYVKAFKGRVGYINPRSLGTNCIGASAPVRFILFPTFQKDADATLTPITKVEAVTELYRCCFNKSALPDAGLPSLTALAQNAECYRLVVGSPGETVRLIESLYEHTSPVEVPVVRSTTNRPRTLSPIDRKASRREVLKVGAKLAYVAPCVLTLTSRQAFAAASDPSGICSTATHTGSLCETDMDCCSRKCNLGVCQ